MTTSTVRLSRLTILVVVLGWASIAIPPSSDDGYIIVRARNLISGDLPLDVIVRGFGQFQGSLWELILGVPLEFTDSLVAVRLPGVVLAVATWHLMESLLRDSRRIIWPAFAIWSFAATDIATSLRPEGVIAFLSVLQFHLLGRSATSPAAPRSVYWIPAGLALATHQAGVMIVVLAAIGLLDKDVRGRVLLRPLIRSVLLGASAFLLALIPGPPLGALGRNLAAYDAFVVRWAIPYGPPLAPHLEPLRIRNLLPGGAEFTYIGPTIFLIGFTLLTLVLLLGGVRRSESNRWLILLVTLLSLSLTSSKWATHYLCALPLLILLAGELDGSSPSMWTDRVQVILAASIFGAITLSVIAGGVTLFTNQTQLQWMPPPPEGLRGLVIIAWVVAGASMFLFARGSDAVAHVLTAFSFLLLAVRLLNPVLHPEILRGDGSSFAASHLSSITDMANSCAIPADVRMDDGRTLADHLQSGNTVYAEMSLATLVLCAKTISPERGLWSTPDLVLAGPTKLGELPTSINTNFLVADLYRKRSCSIDVRPPVYGSFCIYALDRPVVPPAEQRS